MAILTSLGAVRGNWKNNILVKVRVSCILQKVQIKWLKRMTAFTFLSCKIVHKRYPGLKLYQKCPWAYYLILASLMCGFQAQSSGKFLQLQLSRSFREHPQGLSLLTFIYISWATPPTREAAKWRFLVELIANITDILLWREKERINIGENPEGVCIFIIEMHLVAGKQRFLSQ